MTTKTSVLAEGLYFGEGPRWRDGQLWFSDFYDQAVKTCSPTGAVSIAFHTPMQPSGLGWLPDGRMLIVSMQDRRLLRREDDGTLVTHADLSGIATFHCNDMVVDATGRAYVGNFGFDLDEALVSRGVESTLADHATATLARVDPDGSVHAAADGMHFPNGSVITPDGSTLVVGETLSACLTAFDIGADGSLSNRRSWAACPEGRVPDGICLDADGHIWVANPLANEVFLIAEGGELLDSIETTRPCYACMLGGEDGRTLYCLTSNSAVAAEASAAREGRVEIATAGAPRAGYP